MTPEQWVKSDGRDIQEYPIGTKFKAYGGGYWIRTERGFKWCTGATFYRPGADWDGTVCFPNNEKYGGGNTMKNK